MFRLVVAYVLAAISLGAIVWCAAAAKPVQTAPNVQPGIDSSLQERIDALAVLVTDIDQPKATTTVALAKASAAELAKVPQGRIDERQHQVKLVVVHEVVMDKDNAFAQVIREGFTTAKYNEGLRAYVDDGLGAVKFDTGIALAPTTRFAPTLTTMGTKTTATFTIVLLRQLATSDQPVIGFERPTGQFIADKRTVILRTGEWRVIRIDGIEGPPEGEDVDRLEFDIAGGFDVDVRLAHDSHGFRDAEPGEGFSWEPALGVLTAAVVVVLLFRGLGTNWWRSLPNRELVLGLLLSAVALLLAQLIGEWKIVGFLIVFGALPLLAVRHAGKVVPQRPPWTTNDALVVIGLGALIATGMLVWSANHGQVPQATLATSGTIAAVAAAGSAVAFSADLALKAVVVRLAALSAGAAIGTLAITLWIKALLAGVYPPDSITLVLALIWALIPIAGVAVATRRWSRVAIAGSVVVALLIQGWPTEWLDPGSWSLKSEQVAREPIMLDSLELNPATRGMLGLLLVAFVLLVLRLRRFGAAPDALTSPPLQATALALLMVTYLTYKRVEPIFGIDVPLPTLTITSLVAWGAALWLLAGPHPAHVEPATPEEHRDLVRDALHRRLLHGSEQEFYRVGRGRLASGELSLEDFDRQRTALAQELEEGDGHHPETAFATCAARSPWHNGFLGFVVSLLLSLPFAFVYGLPEGVDLTTFVFNTRYLFTLSAFGFVFGYFYPRIRGTQPMTKALYLMAAVLVTELSAYSTALVDPDLSGMDKLVAVAIVTGQVALACIGLGLFWEWHIMHVAGEPWGRVRNIRTVRSLATPLLAVVIAAGTTAATSAAGKTVDRVLKGDTVTSELR